MKILARIKITISVSLLTTIIVFGNSAQVWTSGAATVALSNNGKTLTITGEGAMEDHGVHLSHPTPLADLMISHIMWGAAPWCTASPWITDLIIENAVSVIGMAAFHACKSVTSITIQNTIPPKVNHSAFNSIDKANACLYVPQNSINAYRAAEGWKEFKCIKPIVAINVRADTICSWKSGATTVTLNGGTLTVGGLGAMEDYVLFHNSALASSIIDFVVKENVTYIGDKAFQGLSNLMSIKVATDNIHYSAMDGVLFNKNKTVLIQYPLGKPDTHYTIPSSVNYIEKYAFNGCANLFSITIPDSVFFIGEMAFTGTNLTSIVIPKAMTSIGDFAFSYTALTSVNIPNGVVSIGNYAFSDCDKLETIIIPKSVAEIGRSAFYGCNNLKSITIPRNVAKIGQDAFKGCTNLKTINVQRLIPPKIEKEKYYADFIDKHSVCLYIPFGHANIFYLFTEKWNDFNCVKNNMSDIWFALVILLVLLSIFTIFINNQKVQKSSDSMQKAFDSNKLNNECNKIT